jgi:hypothetical protein
VHNGRPTPRDATQLNAHCLVHERCHFDKTTNKSLARGRSGQGRPLGALALWPSPEIVLITWLPHPPSTNRVDTLCWTSFRFESLNMFMSTTFSICMWTFVHTLVLKLECPPLVHPIVRECFVWSCMWAFVFLFGPQLAEVPPCMNDVPAYVCV